MKWFYDLKIATKLIASFLIVLALTSVIGVFSIIQLGQVNQATMDIRDDWMPSVRIASTTRFLTTSYRLKEYRHLAVNSSQEQAALEQETTELKKQIEAQIVIYEKLISNPEERQLFETYKGDWTAYQTLSTTLLALFQQHLDAEATALLVGESKRIFELISRDLNKMVELNDAGAATADAHGAALYEHARVAIIIALVVALFVGLGLALFISRVISKPLKQAASVTAQLAEGNLNVHIDAGSKDETGMVLNALQNMVGKLSHIINVVRNSAENLASASEQISATAQSMSHATSEQAASVEETSASVEQMSASINQNTENAKVTDGMASKSAKEATDGGQSVQQTVVAMKKIAQRISIIDDIAYQTNLLALNAAIEAARAGEHGKGFAVVAAEVRKLAERSQVAAQEIGELSSSSVELAERAGKLLDEIVPSINKTSDLVQEISAASEEQAAGVAQINTAMTLLNQVTQQNASSSEELAATAEEMSSQAEQLRQAISFFTLETQPKKTSPSAGMNNGSTSSRVQPRQLQLVRQTAFSRNVASAPDESEFTRF